MNKHFQISVLVLLSFLLSACFSQKKIVAEEPASQALTTQTSKATTTNATLLDGLWLYKGLNINNTGLRPMKAGAYKTILNGKFISFSTNASGAIVSGHGDFEIVSDSVLIEKVTSNANATLNNKSNKMTYKLIDNKFLVVKYLLLKNSNNVEVNQWYEELWERQEMPIKQLSPFIAEM